MNIAALLSQDPNVDSAFADQFRGPRNADYDEAFAEGAQARMDGASPDCTNPYDDWSFPRAMKAGWRDGFASVQSARDEWESENHWRARNFGSAS